MADQNLMNQLRSTELLQMMTAMQNNHANFSAGTISPLAYSRHREKLLAQAIEAIAMMHDVKLKTPLQIDSNGEFSIEVPLRCVEPFGNGFNELLNRHNPRCGIASGARLLPENGWCKLNHFDAERLIIDYCSHMSRDEVQETVPAPGG